MLSFFAQIRFCVKAIRRKKVMKLTGCSTNQKNYWWMQLLIAVTSKFYYIPSRSKFSLKEKFAVLKICEFPAGFDKKLKHSFEISLAFFNHENIISGR